MKILETPMPTHKVVSRDQWLEARKAHLAREKELTHQRDELSKQRRDLPWVKVEKSYVFDGPHGEVTLSDLFEGRSQLVVYHFMLGPDWKEGCPGCSFLADHFDGARMHFEHHDLKFVAISRGLLSEIEKFKKRMGWQFNWVSSQGCDFNFDYHVSFTKEDLAKGKVYYNYEMREGTSDEMPGLSVFFKDSAGNIFHTYSAYERGLDQLLGAYNFLDLTPKGRNETKAMEWVRHHDRYENSPVTSCCH